MMIEPQGKTLKILPAGWPCRLSECEPGHFVYGDSLCFKSEYRTAPDYIKIEAFNEAGEYFCPDEDDPIVQPVEAWWEAF